MSKVDAQRAMREARFAALQAQAQGSASTARRTPPDQAAPAPRTRTGRANRTPDPTEPPASPAPPTPDPTEEPAEQPRLCGHRSIGNKSCQRPAGHPEKNHRYT